MIIGDKNMAIEIEPQGSERYTNKLIDEIIEEENKGITKMDIKALRQADSVVFHINEIIAIKEKEEDPFPEMQYAIPVDYEKEAYGKGMFYKAQYVLMWAKDNAVWQTIISLLREGDKIILSWKKGWGDNELLEDAGLTEDALYLKVQRKGKTKYTFLLITRIGRKGVGGLVQ